MIQRRVTILDREKLGLAFEVYCTAKLQLPTKDNLEAFEAAIATWPEVVQCATVTGSSDYELHIVTRDADGIFAGGADPFWDGAVHSA